MRRSARSVSGTSAVSLLLWLSALVAGCALAGPEGSHRTDCENRGYTRGTGSYNRCLSDAGGRSFLMEFDRNRSIGR